MFTCARFCSEIIPSGVSFTSARCGVIGITPWHGMSGTMNSPLNPSSIATDERVLNKANGSGAGWTFNISHSSPGDMRLKLIDASNNIADVTVAAGVVSSVWQHVTVTVHRGSTTGIIFYLNGAVVGTPQSDNSVNQSISTSGISLGIGTIPNFLGNYFPGNIDEVGIWNRALSASEVATLYHSGSGDPFGNSSCGFSY